MAMTCRAVLLLPKALIIISILFLASMWQPMVVAGSAPSGSYRFELIHVDANRSFTREEVIRRAVSRTRLRAVMLAAEEEDGAKNDAFSGSVSIPVEYSPYVYVMELKMGTLPATTPFLAVADTGSEVVWTKQMKMCTGSPSFSTTNGSCADKCLAAGKVCNTCILNMTYGGGKLWMKGFTGMEKLALPPGTDTKKPPEVGLVCATEWTDVVLPTSAQGIVGLSRGPMSLMTQLHVTKFSYCLNDPLKTTARSPLVLWLGDAQPTGGNGWRSTPLVKIPGNSRYYVELQGICVQLLQPQDPSKKKTQCSEPLKPADFRWESQGKGLMMVDSGSTYTHLDHELFKVLKELLFEVVQVHVVPKDYPHNLVLNCFEKPPTEDMHPDLVLMFAEADLRLPWDNYVNKDHCLNIEDATMSILGAMQQQNMHMLYDLAEDKLSFKEAVLDCSEQL